MIGLLLAMHIPMHDRGFEVHPTEMTFATMAECHLAAPVIMRAAQIQLINEGMGAVTIVAYSCAPLGEVT